MKQLAYILLAVVWMWGCNRSESESIQYKNVYSAQLKGANKKSPSIDGMIGFENTYKDKNFKLKELNMDIRIDGIDVGTYYSRETMSILSNSELKIPFSYSFDNSKLNGGEGVSDLYVLVIKGTANFTDAEGNEEKVDFNYKESLNTIGAKGGKKSNSTPNDTGLSKSEIRKLKKENKKKLRLGNEQ